MKRKMLAAITVIMVLTMSATAFAAPAIRPLQPGTALDKPAPPQPPQVVRKDVPPPPPPKEITVKPAPPRPERRTKDVPPPPPKETSYNSYSNPKAEAVASAAYLITSVIDNL